MQAFSLRKKMDHIENIRYNEEKIVFMIVTHMYRFKHSRFFLIGPPFGRNYNCSCVPQNDSEQSLHIRAVPTVAQHLYFSMLTFSGAHQNDILYKLHKLCSKIRNSVIRSSLKILIPCRKSYLKICYPILKGANIGLIA